MNIQNVIIPPASVVPASTNWPIVSNILSADYTLVTAGFQYAVPGVGLNTVNKGIYVVQAAFAINNPGATDDVVEVNVGLTLTYFGSQLLLVPAGKTIAGSIGGVGSMPQGYTAIEIYGRSTNGGSIVKALLPSGAVGTQLLAIQLGQA